MSNRLINFSITRSLWVYWLLALMTFGIGAFIINIQVDTDPENMLSESEPARVFHNQVKETFLLKDIIVVGAVATSQETIFNHQSLTDLKSLTDQILTIEGVQKVDVNSLSTIDNIEQAGKGTIRFEWMMANAPTTDRQAQLIGEKSSRLPFVVNSIVSGDEKAATVYVPILDKNESYRISNEIQAIIENLGKANEYHITGLPVAEDTFGVEMFIQMGISAPVAALVIYLLMLYFFRSASLVAAPMIVAMSTVIIIMGAMIGFGYTVHIMSSMIPIFLMPIAVVDSVHLMSEFTDRYKPGFNAKKVIKEVTSHLFQPMLFTSVTSAAGFFSLALTPIPPVQIFGLFVGSGIILAFLITIFFIPAYISRMSEQGLTAMQQKLHSNTEGEDATASNSRLAKILPSWGKFSVRRAKLIITVSLLIIGVSLVGITKIEINDNPVRWFKSEHPIRVADRVLNKHFAGTYDAHLVFESADKTAQVNLWKKVINNAITKSRFSQETINQFEQLINQNMTVEELQTVISYADDLSFESTDQQAEILLSIINETDKLIQQLKVFTQPEVLGYIERLQSHLVQSGFVGKSNSMVDLVKTVNRELISGRDEDFKIPNSQNAVAQTLLQFQSSHRPQDLWHFVTPSFDKALVWLQMTSGDNQDMANVVEVVNQYLETNPPPQNISVDWAGKAYLNLVWQEKMVAGMFDSLTSAFVIVFLMMVILFRSIIFGVLAMLPLSITILFMYGLIGWTGKYYDMPIAVLSALTLGLSVDFAIHFIERTRANFQQTQSWAETINLMFQEPANAIVRNALVIAIGFTPLLLAPLVPYITVGAFLATIMAVSALVTILLLPASMQLIRRFIFKESKQSQ